MTAKKAKPSEGTIDVTVFVPRGQVREGDIKKAAMLAVRDKIPATASASEPVIDSAGDVRESEGMEGRDYIVKVSYTNPEGAEEPVTVDKVLASLDALTPEKLAEVTGTAQEA